jgi:hypothetical protein
MKFKLEFDMDNDAFWFHEDVDSITTREPNYMEQVRILCGVITDIKEFHSEGEIIRDRNGNTIGKWEVEQ